MRIPWAIAALAVMLGHCGCSNDTGLSSQTDKKKRTSLEQNAGRSPDDPTGDDDNAPPTGSSEGDDPSRDDDKNGDQKLPLDPVLEAKTLEQSVDNVVDDKLVDYVLVLDNSSSMEVALVNARNGLKAVIDEHVFNGDARIGVMTTMPGKPTDLTKTHPAVAAHTGAALEPGFLRLATESQRLAYAGANASSASARFPLKLCNDGFFSPYGVHADGHRCLEAAMQTSFSGVAVEDGIVSFHQMILRQGASKLFRDGAEVNVVFISDVHAPGVAATRPMSTDLFDLNQRPTAASIRSAIDQHNTISRLTFHAIVPPQAESGCTEAADQWGLGTSYYPVVDATQGSKHPICQTAGYKDFFSGMVKEAQAKTSHLINLPPGVAKVTEVLVDGVATTDFAFDPQSGLLTLLLTKLDKKVLAVKVNYTVPKP